MILSFLISFLNLYPAANAVTQAGAICRGKIGECSVLLSIAKLHPLTTTLTINGREIPRAWSSCRYEYRNYRCPHRLNGIDFEVSPILESSEVLNAFVVVTSNSGSQLIELKDCEPAQ